MAAKSASVRAGHARRDEQNPFGASTLPLLWRRFGTQSGFAIVALLLVVGWSGRETRSLTAEHGLGYLLGFVALACMLGLLGYPLRKRVRALKALGPVRNWFRLHMTLGLAGTLAALYHCNFRLGSVDSRVALFSALLVAGSGLIGRFLYAKVHHGLYGRKATLKELLAQISFTGPEGGRVASFVPELMERVKNFDRSVLVPAKNAVDAIKLLLRLIVATRLEHRRLMLFTREVLRLEASYSTTLAMHRRRLEKATQRYLSKHLRQVRRVAEFSAYERLFSLWHKVHLPFFVLLVLSLAIHLWAVYAY